MQSHAVTILAVILAVGAHAATATAEPATATAPSPVADLADGNAAPGAAGPAMAAPPGRPGPAGMADIWHWPVVLFFTSFAIGVLAVLGGVGGGVLYVPIIAGFMPFHIDFVRCSGLLLGVANSLAAGPGLLKRGLANLRLVMPLALVASGSSIAGAMLGMLLPDWIVYTTMGVLVIGITILMATSRRSEYPDVEQPGAVAWAFGAYGLYHERSGGHDVRWQVHRMRYGLVLFAGVGLLAGMFGLGAGWAAVPVLNLLMGAPLKVAVATSVTMISVTGSTAAWVYLNSGAALPLLVVPSIAGAMLGSRVGVKLLSAVRPSAVRVVVLTLLVFAGLRMLLKGLGVW